MPSPKVLSSSGAGCPAKWLSQRVSERCVDVAHHDVVSGDMVGQRLNLLICGATRLAYKLYQGGDVENTAVPV